MREILFRGKRVDNGEWFNGFYGKSGEKAYIIYDNDIAVAYVSMKEVTPETIGQYTGLTDKNGKKIFEGDIVKHKGYVFCCKWNEYNYEYVFDDGEADFGIGYTAPYELEVIGNIHDNPELLKGGAE